MQMACEKGGAEDQLQYGSASLYSSRKILDTTVTAKKVIQQHNVIVFQ